MKQSLVVYKEFFKEARKYVRITCVVVIFLLLSMPFIGLIEETFVVEASGSTPDARIGIISEDRLVCASLATIDFIGDRLRV